MNQRLVEEIGGPDIKSSRMGVSVFLRLLSKSSIFPILILVWVIFAMLSPAFGTLRNVQTMLAATAVVAVAAIGETLVLISAGIDLSVATVAACSAVLAAKAMETHGNPLVGLLAALAVGLIFGIVNGVSVAKLGLTPFVLTLGTHLIARGIAFSVSRGYAIRAPKVIRQFGNANWLGPACYRCGRDRNARDFRLFARQNHLGTLCVLVGSKCKCRSLRRYSLHPGENISLCDRGPSQWVGGFPFNCQPWGRYSGGRRYDPFNNYRWCDSWRDEPVRGIWVNDAHCNRACCYCKPWQMALTCLALIFTINSLPRVL